MCTVMWIMWCGAMDVMAFFLTHCTFNLATFQILPARPHNIAVFRNKVFGISFSNSSTQRFFIIYWLSSQPAYSAITELKEGELYTLMVMDSGSVLYNTSFTDIRPQSTMLRFLLAKDYGFTVTAMFTPNDSSKCTCTSNRMISTKTSPLISIPTAPSLRAFVLMGFFFSGLNPLLANASTQAVSFNMSLINYNPNYF